MHTVRVIAALITMTLMMVFVSGTVNAAIPVYGSMSSAGYRVLNGGSGAVAGSRTGDAGSTVDLASSAAQPFVFTNGNFLSVDNTDNIPPVTTATPSAGAFVTPLTVTLSCSDGAGSGCAGIYYCLGTGCIPSILYTAPLAVAVTTTLNYNGVDIAGNAETAHTANFINTDTTPPVTTLSPPAGSVTVPQSVTLSCNDGAGSGCAAIYYCLGTGCTPSSVYSAPLYLSASTALSFYAIDYAGNQETVQTASFAIINDPASTLTGPMTREGREYHTATLLPNGKVLVAGGYNLTYYTATAELFNPADNTWAPAASMPSNRYLHTATLLPSGKVLVTGGMYYDGQNFTSLSSALMYDPTSNTWSAAASMSTSRFGHTATLLSNGKVLVTGGDNLITGYLPSAEVFDPASNSWSAVASMSIPRSNHAATLLSDGKVLVTGGSNSNSGYLNTAEVYDPSSNTWAAVGAMNASRSYHSATLLLNGEVLVTGPGMTYDLYNPTFSTFVGSYMSYYRNLHSSTLLADGKVLLAGGTSSLSVVESYDPSSNSFKPLPALSNPRYGHKATLLNSGKVLLVGGTYYDGSYHDVAAELFNPTILQVPGAPTSVSATAGYKRAYVSFAAPASSGSSAITSYVVAAYPGGMTATGSTSPITISGLTTGISYTFTVTAVNAAGMGPPSLPSNGVTPPDDVIPPTTTPSPSGGTYNGSQNVFLSCADGTGSYCAGTWYCFGSGCTPLLPYSQAIALNSSQLLRFFSQDNAGNSEAVKSAFYTINPVRLVGPGWVTPAYFETFANACGSVQNGDTIQAEALIFNENMYLDTGRSIAIEGGYDNTFTTNGGNTVLQGTLTIGNDAVIIRNLTIR